MTSQHSLSLYCKMRSSRLHLGVTMGVIYILLPPYILLPMFPSLKVRFLFPMKMKVLVVPYDSIFGMGRA